MPSPLEQLSAHFDGHYRIERELGAGGMATVYLAHDVKHGRHVAIKVLRPELAAVIGGERFLAEIRTTALLQHPHILPLFDSGEAGSFLFYVMPYLEGESLRDRLNRETQLAIGDAARIAGEVASALEYAHRRGIIHRDIKPENVLFHDGRAMVADFGIALAATRAGGGRMTATGMSLGTPQYMSPEQAMGEREITARSDVYALGAMTYEMLVGEPPYTGPSAQAIIAKVLTEKPKPPSDARKSIPPHVEDAVLTALEKLPADRFPSAAAFAEALAIPGTASDPQRAVRPRDSGSRAATPAQQRQRQRILIGGAGTVAIAAVALGWVLHAALRRPATPVPTRLAFTLGVPGVDRPHLDISPDGRRIIQVVSDSNGVDRIVMRDLARTEIVPVAGSEGAIDPVFSLDGTWISFNADGHLKKVPVTGGPAVDIIDSASVGGGAWMPDGSIIYTRDGRGLWRVPSAGGAPRQVTTLDTVRKEFNHWYPQALPGGRAVIYTAYATPIARASIEAYDLKTKQRKVLVEGGVYGRYAASGHLLYARDGAIFAVAFDPKTLAVRGTPVPVQTHVSWVATDGLAGYAIAANGTLAYLAEADWNVERRVVWADRSGREEPALPSPGSFAEPRLSPDGRWIVVTVTEPRRELWLYDIARGVLTPLSRTQNAAFNALWAPDSRSVVYAHEDPVYDLHRLAIDGSGASSSVVASRWDKFASAISPDGKSIVYVENNNSDRLFIARLDSSGIAPRALTTSGTAQRSAAFSPNGKWIAYEELAHGQPDIYVVASDGSGGRRQVSVEGGEQPRWTRGGREIVYRRGSAVMAVPVDSATGDVGKPLELFRKGQPDRLGGGRTMAYDVSADGNRFLLVLPQQRAGSQPTTVVMDWFEELRARVMGTR
jgi:serine/threonine-protein kinase